MPALRCGLGLVTMRPKKRILLITADEYEMSTLRFLFETCGYRVLAAETADDALKLCANAGPEIGIISMPFPGAKELVADLRAIAPFTPVISISAKPLEVHTGLGTCANLSRAVSAAELLERVKVFSIRKRGPRKGMGKATLQRMEEATA